MARLFMALAVLVSFVAASESQSRADEVCSLWAKYIWEFTPQAEVRNPEVKKVNVRESIGGLFEKSSAAYPFPGVPRSLDKLLGEKIKNKVHTLYNKYVLLDRRIDDLWRDRFNRDGSALQTFFTEREQVVAEMTQTAREAKTEMIAWGVRDQDCFADFESLVRKESTRTRKELTELQHVKESCLGQSEGAGEARAPAARKGCRRTCPGLSTAQAAQRGQGDCRELPRKREPFRNSSEI